MRRGSWFEYVVKGRNHYIKIRPRVYILHQANGRCLKVGMLAFEIKQSASVKFKIAPVEYCAKNVTTSPDQVAETFFGR